MRGSTGGAGQAPSQREQSEGQARGSESAPTRTARPPRGQRKDPQRNSRTDGANAASPQQGQREDQASVSRTSGTGPCITYNTVSNDATGHAAIRLYLEAGFGLSDIYCQRYFVIASQSRLKRRFARNAFTSVDSLVGTILSLTAAGETALGIVNAGFGAVDSTFQNMDDSFLVAADLENVRALVQSAQDGYRSEATRTERLASSYPAARSVIERYAGICSFTGMRRLVNASVGAQTRQIDQETARSTQGTGAPAPAAPAAPAPAAPAPAVPAPAAPAPAAPAPAVPAPAAPAPPEARPDAMVPVPPVHS